MLYFSNQNGISGSWNSGNGILSLSGSATVVNYQTAIRSITYENLNTTDPTTASRSITFVVNDGTVDSNIATITVTILQGADAMVTELISTTPQGQADGNSFYPAISGL